MNRPDPGPALIAGVSLLTAAIFIVAIPDHVFDSSWPIHARNHALQSLFWIVGFCLLTTLVALKPLQNGAEWALWGVGLAGGFVFGGYFVPIVVTGGGAPGLLDDVVFTVLFTTYAAGVGLAFSDQRTDGP